MRSLFVALAAAFVLSAGLVAQAARDAGSDTAIPTDGELLVMEIEGCVYCELFRRDVLPGYLTSSRARSLPIRFIDLNKSEVSGIKLEAPLTVVPTIVLIREGREVGRISGYTGPENFYHLIAHMAGQGD